MTMVLGSGGFLRSPGMQAATAEAEAAVSSAGGVLICGEPGTGRESMARAIHRASTSRVSGSIEDLLHDRSTGPDAGCPFVVVDCAAFREVERAVFGDCPSPNGDGGLDRITRSGLLYQACRGTLFLRSVQEMPQRAQARLARVLRDGAVWLESATGRGTSTPVCVRTIASIEPSFDVQAERIVPDLRRRLAAHRIELPPLRQRKDDIPGLIRVLLVEIGRSLQIPSKTASAQAVELLCALPWRGNIDEMRGLLCALTAKTPGRLIRLSDVLGAIRLDCGTVTCVERGTLKEARERFEREYVAAVLEQHHGRMGEVARALGIQRTNLYRKMKQLSVHRKVSRRL